MNAPFFRLLALGLVSLFFSAAAFCSEANRLVYLMESDPFYVGGSFPKLATPQWVGDSNVEAVVTLGIDDMRASQPYENFFRPILERLKKIDGRAPVSIFSVAPKADDPRLQEWIKEGLSLEVHTLTHPCPILAQSNFVAAANVYFGCIDLLASIPGNHPVAFRTPCCDSINSASPRLFAELMAKTSPTGKFLQMDSSVVMLFTTNDTSIAAADLVDASGKARFQKYAPFPAFKTTIENYPYPYVVNNALWEMPFVGPSDWESHNIQGDLSPQLAEDWKKALDIVVQKRGLFNFVFHPHGWSSAAQFVEFIDHAEQAHPGQVKFLTYPETLERMNKNMLAGQPLRAADGGDNGVRMLDLNNDGYLDVVIGNAAMQRSRVWDNAGRRWIDSEFPARLIDAQGGDNGVRFGIVRRDGAVSLVLASGQDRGAWSFDGSQWKEDRDLLNGLDATALFSRNGRDRGARFRDVDNDGVCELIISNESQNIILQWDNALRKWSPAGFTLPPQVSIVNENGEDNGARFVDVNGDGLDDLIFSNEERYSFHLFIPQLYLGFARGWTRQVSAGSRSDPEAIPAIVRAGPHRNNGAWFHSRTLWVQNEDTAHLPDLVERRSFGDLMIGSKPQPKSPAEALTTFQLPETFQIEAVATEPLVIDPVAFDWDAQGRLWVVEMRDYPLGMDGRGKPGGVIKLLRDTDRDGKYDTATEFLKEVGFPNGIMPWRDGVLISAAPTIFYAADTNGDGVADIRKTLVTGFAEGNQQHRINGFEMGMDGWVYCANGESGGTLRAVDGVLNKSGVRAEPLRLRGDFRFRPDTGEIQAIEGTTQFGRRRDDWDHWFGNNNPTWLWHYFLAGRHIEHNPALRIADLRVITAENNDLFPAGKTQQRFNDIGRGNTTSAANSPTCYRDDLFGAEFVNSVFISDPSFNLVHREILEPDGVTFKSHRAVAERSREFLSSTDNWFRPTMLKIGPDGALYIADMYRFVLEHPEWIPADVQKHLDLRAGDDKGRIYRVYPKGASLRPMPNLQNFAPPDLAAQLNSKNGWTRDMAQKLIVWQNAGIPDVRNAAKSSPLPEARAQALWTLENLGALTEADVLTGFHDGDPRVRAQAVRASESIPAKNDQIGAALSEFVTGPDLPLAFQAALVLYRWPQTAASKALLQAARTHLDDQRFQIAVLSSALPHLGNFYDEIADHPPTAREAKFASELFALAPTGNAVDRATQALKRSTGIWRLAAFGELLDAIARKHDSLEAYLKTADPRIRASFTDLQQLRTSAGEIAFATETSEADRIAAIRVITQVTLLNSFLAPNFSPAVQKAALEQIAKSKAASTADDLVAAWQQAGPALRQEILPLFFTRQDWIDRLLTALESGKIPANVIDPARQQALRTHLNTSVSNRARKIFASASGNRAEVIARFETAKTLRGDAANGVLVFRQNCAPCHRFRNEGATLAPDLGSVAEKPLEYLLTAILDPNQSVEARYLNYEASLKDGGEASGIITAETASSVTLAAPNDLHTTLLRAEIATLRSTGKSLMPEGFENGLTPQALADLFAFLRSNIRPKSFPGNTPRMVQPSTDGSVHLTAGNAEIFGDTLEFEPTYRNLGYWESENDRATWTARLARPGVYDVYLNYALPEATDSNRVRVEAGSASLTAPIASTISWDKYKISRIGSLELPAGDQTLTISAQKPLRGPLLDLKEILLLPSGQAPPQSP